jgi:hypothetical protein
VWHATELPMTWAGLTVGDNVTIRSMIRPRFHHVAMAAAIFAGVVVTALSLATIGAAAPKADAGATLSAEQWGKIVKAMNANGQTRILPFKVADHLGLTRGSETLTVRELAFEREGYQHGIYTSVAPGDDRVILVFRTPEKRWTAFVASAGFKLVTAIVWNAGETPVPWPNDEALPAFKNELTYWSVVADLL